MIRIMARITAKSEAAGEVRAALHELVAPTRKEKGCLSYELFQGEDNPAEFITTEQWADQAAADAHMGTPHVAAAIARVGALLAQPPLIHRFKKLA